VNSPNSKNHMDKIGQLATFIVDSQDQPRQKLTDEFVSGILNLENVGPLEDYVRRYLIEQLDTKEALKRLLYDPKECLALVDKFAQEKNRNIDIANLNHEKSIDLLLEMANLRQIKWPSKYRGITNINKVLDQTRSEIRLLRKEAKVTPEKILYYGAMGWLYLETLLKISVRYYAKLFGCDDNYGDIGGAFKHAVECKELNPIIEAIISIENKFARDSTNQRLSQWLIDRSSPFYGFLNEDVDLEIKQLHQDQIDFLKQKLSDAQKQEIECAILAQDKFITVKSEHKFRADIKFYRNFYVHKDLEYARAVGFERAKNSFYAAREIIAKLFDLNILPTLIVPIELGQDGCGRQILRFLREDQINEYGLFDSEINISLAFFGLSNGVSKVSTNINLYEFYVCRTLAFDRMFEPPIYPLSEIYSEESSN